MLSAFEYWLPIHVIIVPFFNDIQAEYSGTVR